MGLQAACRLSPGAYKPYVRMPVEGLLKAEDLDDEPTCSVLECTECGEGFTALRALLGEETYDSITSKNIAGQPIKFAATIDTLGPALKRYGACVSPVLTHR